MNTNQPVRGVNQETVMTEEDVQRVRMMKRSASKQEGYRHKRILLSQARREHEARFSADIGATLEPLDRPS